MSEPEKDPKFRGLLKTLAALWRARYRGNVRLRFDGNGSVELQVESFAEIKGDEMPGVMVFERQR